MVPLEHTIVRTFRMGKAPNRITVKGVGYFRNIPAEWNGRVNLSGNWPQYSDALGVLHSQTREASEHLAAEGVPTNFTNDGTGRCIVENQGHKNRIMEVLKIHDRDACYGQRTRP